MFKVLLVEDDPMVTSINRKFIERLPDFEVVGSASSGQEALELIDKLQPDLVLLDVFMPQQSGIDVLHRVRQQRMETDVILITAAQDTETITEALRLGAVDYLIKPYDFTRLKEALDSFLQRRLALTGKRKLTQQELDHLTPGHTSHTSEREQLPKGLDTITLNKVRQVFREATAPLSATEIGTRLNLSRVTVRRYLEYLEEKGEITVNLKYGKVGRPTRVYSLTSKV